MTKMLCLNPVPHCHVIFEISRLKQDPKIESPSPETQSESNESQPPVSVNTISVICPYCKQINQIPADAPFNQKFICYSCNKTWIYINRPKTSSVTKNVWKLIGLGVLFFISISLIWNNVHSITQQNQTNKYFTKAQKEEKNGDFIQALTDYNMAVKLDHTNSTAYVARERLREKCETIYQIYLSYPGVIRAVNKGNIEDAISILMALGIQVPDAIYIVNLLQKAKNHIDNIVENMYAVRYSFDN